MASNNCALTDEIEKRLNDFFGASKETFVPPGGANQSAFVEITGDPEKTEDNCNPEVLPFTKLQTAPSGVKKTDTTEVSPLTILKTAVMAMQREVNDEAMSLFMEQLGSLRITYSDDNIVIMFLKLLGSVGDYAKSKKGDCHPDTVHVLHSIYTGMEKVLLSDGMTEEERKRILVGMVEKVRKLKEEISQDNARSELVGPFCQQDIKSRIKQPDEEHMALEKKQGEELIDDLVLPDISGMSPHEAFSYALEEIKNVIKAEFSALRTELKLWREGG